MNKLSLPISALMTVATVGGLATSAYGFGEFQRGSLLLETTARATYDSYFIGSTDPKAGDYYFSLHPNLVYDRKAGLAELSGFFGVDVLRYDRNTSYNTENVSGSFNVKLPDNGNRITGTFGVSYIESEDVDFNVLNRIKQKSLSATANLKYQLGLKMAITEAFDFTHIDRDKYSDQTMFHNDISYHYYNFLEDTSLRLTESFDRTKSNGNNVLNTDLDQTSNSVSAGLSRHIYGPLDGEAAYGYRFLQRNPNETANHQKDFSGGFFSFNLHGPFLPPRYFPKIESAASITYQQSQNPGVNDRGEKTVTGNVRLGWQARPETNISFNANRSVELTATDLSVDATEVTLNVTENVGYQTSIGASVGRTWRTYPHTNRSDNTWEASLNATRRFNKYWSAGFSYQYQDNKSNGDSAGDPWLYGVNPHDFSRHLFSLFVTNKF